MKSQAVRVYYTILAVCTLGLVVYTVFIGSQHVGNGRQASKLEKERTALTQQKQQLERELAQRESLTASTQLAETQGYQFSNRVVRIDQHSQVALR